MKHMVAEPNHFGKRENVLTFRDRGEEKCETSLSNCKQIPGLCTDIWQGRDVPKRCRKIVKCVRALTHMIPLIAVLAG